MAPEMTVAPPVRHSLLHEVWGVAVQVAALALTALALWWSTPYADDRVFPLSMHQGFLVLLMLGALACGLVPGWRRGQAAALLGGLTVAMACWLSAGTTFASTDTGQFGLFASRLPLIAPVGVVVALALLLWGGAIGTGPVRRQPFMVAVLSGALLLAVLATLFYAVAGVVAPFNAWYTVSFRQYAGLISMLLLYPLGMWLGAAGVRAEARLVFLPAGMALVLSWFLAHWWLLAHTTHVVGQ